jgi:hypothetical protein
MPLNRLFTLMAVALLLANAWLVSPLAVDTSMTRLLGMLVQLLTVAAFGVAGHRAGMHRRHLTSAAFVAGMAGIWLVGPLAWSLLLEASWQGRAGLLNPLAWLTVGGHLAIFVLAWYLGRRLRAARLQAIQETIDDLARQHRDDAPAGPDNESC